MNVLAEYCQAVDEQNSDAVADLLAETELVFRGEHLRGRDAISRFYADAFTAPSATQHTVSNLWVDSVEDGTAIRYRACYQRWVLGGEPRCSAVGAYVGQVKPDCDTWRWIVHEVTTVVPSS